MSRQSWLAILFAIPALAWLLWLGLHYAPSPPAGEEHELYNVFVLSNLGQYEYWLENEQGIRFHVNFCDDFEPQFSQGMTIKFMKYQDFGRCWSLKNTHPKYIMERDEDGNEIVRESRNGPARTRK